MLDKLQFIGNYKYIICIFLYLGILLIISGILTFYFGLSIYVELRIRKVPLNKHGHSVLTSVWVIMTGVMGVCIAYSPRSRSLIGTYNAFVLTATILTLIAVATSLVGAT